MAVEQMLNLTSMRRQAVSARNGSNRDPLLTRQSTSKSGCSQTRLWR